MAAPSSLDPHLQDDFYATSVLSTLYEALVDLDSEMRIVPALAERWENPDDRTWIFHLRPGVTFHDGRPLTAAHVVGSLNRAIGHDRSQRVGFLLAVREYEALDAQTLRIRTERPAPLLLNKLAFILVVPDFSHEEIVAPIGTGPYRFVARHEDGSIELKRYEDYWGSRPWAEEALIKPVPDHDRRLSRLLKGQTDLIVPLQPEGVARVEASAGVRVATRESLDVIYLQFRVDLPPFDDPRVRRAVHLAVDRAALATEIGQSYGEPAGQMVGRYVTGYAPDLTPPERDLETARHLLAEAGYPGGLDVTLEYRPGRQVELLKSQLADVGIRVELAPQPWTELYPRMSRGEVSFYLGTWINPTIDASDLFANKIHTRDPDSGYGANNGARYSNPELDRLIEAARDASDIQTRQETLARCMRLLMEDLPLVPLYAPDQLMGIRESLAFRPRIDGRVRVQDIRMNPLP